MTSDVDTAVLLTCHGTVDDVRDIPEFVRKIRRGNPAPEEVITEVTRRFELIGGSPLMAISRAQAGALERRLGIPVRAAGRLWGPYPLEVLSPLEGLRRVVSLPLAPQSVHVYHDFVARELEGKPIELVRVPAYGLDASLVGAFTNAIIEAMAPLDGKSFAILLTAHSLPMRVIAGGDPYQRDFEAMAGAIRARLVAAGVPEDSISVAYQSQGMGGGEWLGPDLKTAFEATRDKGRTALLVAPVGFVAEHVETLFDIDVEAAAMAKEMGFTELVRMPAMNDRADFIDALESVARAALESR